VHADLRALEAALVARCRARRAPVRERLCLVVPSAGARVPTAGRLVRAAGGALVGVRVVSALGLALERLAVHGARAARAPTGLSGHVLLVRAVAGSPRLARVLGPLDDGAEVGARAAQELVDAGLAAHLAEALDDLLAELPDGLRERTRDVLAAALARAPGGAFEGGQASVFARAAEVPAPRSSDGEQVVLVAPEAAAGPEADFLEALVRSGAEVHLVRGARGPFAQRVLASDAAGDRGEAGVAARLVRANALDPESAARAAARHAAARIAGGTSPEDVLIVCTDPDAGATRLARELVRLGVPFSAPSARGDLDLGLRPLAALARLLRERDEADASTLVELADDEGLALELLARGAGSVARLAAPGPAATRSGRLAAAAHLCRELEGAARTLAQWNARLAQAVADGLGPEPGGPAHARLCDVLDALERTFADEGARELALSGPEWVGLVAPRLLSAARRPLGGAGAGVVVATPEAARGRAADVVVLLGFERGAFPRRRGDDPLLDERVRVALRPLVPDLATSSDARAHDEALLESLLGAADEVVVVHAERDAAGREVALAPALERRLVEHAASTVAAARAGSFEDAGAGPLDATEWARLAALAYSRTGEREAERVLRHLLAPLHTSPLAAEAHLASLLEHDSIRAGLGGLGRVPAAALAPSHHVTRLEDVARCGWQAHLARDLRLAEPVRGDLPTPDARAVGTAVHAALERLLESRTAAAAELDPQRARRVPRPSAELLERTIHHGVEQAATRTRVGALVLAAVPGARAWLTARVRPLVENGVRELWAEGEPRVLATEREFEHALATPDGPTTVRFRADLVAVEGETLVGVDFKTSAAPSPAKKEETRRKALLASVQRGDRLQAAAYALALGGLGRYLHLGGDEDDESVRSATIDAETAANLLPGVVARIERARDRGLVLPRLVEARLDEESTPTACRRCVFVGACVQGDTGWRERLRNFVRAGAEGAELDDDAAAALSWFMLHDDAQNTDLRGEA
jgi:hypothetical protein